MVQELPWVSGVRWVPNKAVHFLLPPLPDLLGKEVVAPSSHCRVEKLKVLRRQEWFASKLTKWRLVH